MNLEDGMKHEGNEVERRHAQLERIERSLTNVAPTADGIKRIEYVREAGKRLAGAIVYNSPASREQSLALTHLENAIMWCVKSIVLEEGGD